MINLTDKKQKIYSAPRPRVCRHCKAVHDSVVSELIFILVKGIVGQQKMCGGSFIMAILELHKVGYFSQQMFRENRKPSSKIKNGPGIEPGQGIIHGPENQQVGTLTTRPPHLLNPNKRGIPAATK